MIVCQQYLGSYWTFRYSYANTLSTAVSVLIDCLMKAPSQHSALALIPQEHPSLKDTLLPT